jgi:hypothetical protein
MSLFTQADLMSLSATAASAANYLDACDEGGRFVRIDPAYYQACGNLLNKIFSLVDAETHFPRLLIDSPAAKEMAETIRIGRRIEVSRLGFYPELSSFINRVAA